MKPVQTLKIGRFSVLRPLGRGTQGAVYLAEDPDLRRLVAIKLVSDIGRTQSEDEPASSQARNLAQLRHPNIIALYEVGVFHSFQYLVFEYLEGASLREEIKKHGAFPLPKAYSTASQIVDAMAYAHAKGILHLDLKPDNIMRDEEGKPRIMDFDLCRRVEVTAKSNLITGTLPYMAPEHFTTRITDSRTDVYALGQILYELLTGQLAVPFAADEEMITQILDRDADFEPLQRVDPQGHFIDVIQRATHKSPDERFPHARAMHSALIAAWEKTHLRISDEDSAFHGTVAFVLKRIERRGDFPAVTKTLAEINEITSNSSQSSISRLTSVVLRDYALTNRLLKLANSAHYARPMGQVNSVSDAITLIGVEQVRLTCNGLACFGHFAGRKQDQRLREESIASFIAGLLSRHLAIQLKSKETEEAFLAGMLFHLGRMLALFYFTEDYADIEDLVSRGATEDEAARSVLGITLPEMGSAVGKVWGLPAVVIDGMADSRQLPSSQSSVLCLISRFANALTDLDIDKDPDETKITEAAQDLLQFVALDLKRIHGLLAAGIEKFKVFAPALEVDIGSSSRIRRLDTWLKAIGHTLETRTGQEPATTA